MARCRLQLMTIFGIGEQHAGQERPECHRQADLLHEQRRAMTTPAPRDEHFAVRAGRCYAQAADAAASVAAGDNGSTATVFATPWHPSLGKCESGREQRMMRSNGIAARS